MSVVEPGPVKSRWTFLNTYVAVHSGVPLYQYSPAELREAGFMRAWPFNCTKSLITGGISAVVVGVMLYFRPGERVPLPIITTGFWPRVLGEMLNIFPVAEPWLMSFFVLFMIAGFSRVIWLGVRPAPVPDVRLRATKAYLYDEGANGFPPGIIAGIGANLLAALSFLQLRWSLLLWVVSFALFAFGNYLAFRFLYRRLPAYIFEADREHPPPRSVLDWSWLRYLLALGAGTFLAFLTAGVGVAASSFIVSAVIAVMRVLAS